jgi:hypothetical protein
MTTILNFGRELACADEMRRRIVICTSCGEERAHRAHGWCSPCYRRWLRHGRPADGVPAPVPYGCPAGQDEIDHAAVFRAITNDAVPPLTWAERREAARALARGGMSSRAIGAQLGCHPVTAWRYMRTLT